MAKKLKHDLCVIDADPLHCWVREQCHYWNRDTAQCDYKTAQNEEKKQRNEEAFDGAAIMERIRIT